MEPETTHFSGKLQVSDDGYIRIPHSEILALRFVHLFSGLDEDCRKTCTEGACPTSISGYTEWMTDSDPAITVGWDWYLDTAMLRPVYVLHGLPRTNLMALDSACRNDLGDLQTWILLAALIEHLGWQEIILKFISARYA